MRDALGVLGARSRPVALAMVVACVWLPLASVTHSGGIREARFCMRVVDGDTIVLDHDEKVRLIGVDTPELHHPVKPVQYFAREARDRVRVLAGGQRVWLEYDQTRRDRYGRTLAYVFLADGTLLNLRLIEEGYGFAFTKYPFRGDYMRRFRRAEQSARQGDRGLWFTRESRR
jgi:micrococcal nuclease